MFNFLKGKVATNAFWLISANSLVKIIALSYNIFLARALGPANYGLFVFGLTIFGLTAAVSDFGLSRFLTRDLSKKPQQASKFTSQIFTATLFLSATLVVLLILLFTAVNNSLARILIVTIMLATVVPNSLALTLQATFTALEKMQYVAISQIFLNLTVAILGIIAILVFKASVFGVVVGFLIAHFLFLLVFNLFLLYEKIKLNFVANFDFIKTAIKSGFPYAVLAALGLIYLRIDSVMITYLESETATGFYGAAFRFLDGVQFIPIAVSISLFPTFARLHENSKTALRNIYFKALGLLSIAGIFVTLVLFFFSGFIVTLVYGDSYQPSILALKILSFAVFFMFIHVPGAHLLFASEKLLKQIIFLSVLTVGFNVVTNLIFIPIYGFIAAAATTLASEILSFVIFFLLIWFKVFSKNGSS